MVTKWEVLKNRLDIAEQEAAKLRRELEGLKNTPCGLHCSDCGLLLETEADFANHFILLDIRYLNLGDCPKRKKGNEG
jgi:hypothetical protein